MDRGILDSEERVRPKTDLLEEMLCFWYSLFNRVTFRYILAIWGEGFCDVLWVQIFIINISFTSCYGCFPFELRVSLTDYSNYSALFTLRFKYCCDFPFLFLELSGSVY